MYDEFIRRSARRAGVEPLHFDHPAGAVVLESITGPAPVSVVLTGTAGDGKTHLCRQVWEAVGGDALAWQSPEPYVRTWLPGAADGQSGHDGPGRTLHVLRDLSAWVPQRGGAWDPAKEDLLKSFSASLFADCGPGDVFLIAGNDGQLIETWRRLGRSEAVERTQDLLETLLVEDRQQREGIGLRFFNLSRYRSADLLDRALDAFLGHSGWDACRALNAGQAEFFGPECPIRHNVELLETPLVRRRLKDLLALCDYNRLHLPIRQLLLLLVNAVLGHPGVKDRLMSAADVPTIIRDGTTARASLYSNIFGGNLAETRRESILVFDALDRLGIGHETSNRVDNILIFGEADEALREYFDRYMASDTFYGADASYRAAQREYVKGAEESEERGAGFLRLLVAQRRGFFFKVTDDDVEDMRLWELTVFRYAGEYLGRVVAALEAGRRVDRPILSRLVRGLNRIFTGMLVSDDRDLLLATSLALSQGRVSRLLEERISVEPRLGERVEVVLNDGDRMPALEVTLSRDVRRLLPLHLTRYEFLSRVAEGALPSSFSKECYEDLLAFKSQLLSALAERREAGGEEPERDTLAFRLLELEEAGRATVRDLELREV
ncbi:MAG: hypothetical protein IT306_10470 [Chloroflexi bacterium]|nr:hypothetical protein [Chloroflexota bacterium]